MVFGGSLNASQRLDGNSVGLPDLPLHGSVMHPDARATPKMSWALTTRHSILIRFSIHLCETGDTYFRS